MDNPTDLAKDLDPQLQAALDTVLEELEKNPPFYAEPPEFEIR